MQKREKLSKSHRVNVILEAELFKKFMTLLRLMNSPLKAGRHSTFFKAIAAKEGFTSLSKFIRRYVKRFVFNIETALIATYGEEVLAEIYNAKLKESDGITHDETEI